MDATGELKKLQLLKDETGELSSNDEKRFVFILYIITQNEH